MHDVLTNPSSMGMITDDLLSLSPTPIKSKHITFITLGIFKARLESCMHEGNTVQGSAASANVVVNGLSCGVVICLIVSNIFRILTNLHPCFLEYSVIYIF